MMKQEIEQRSLPALPDSTWEWEVRAAADKITVAVLCEGVTIGKRSGECVPMDRENKVYALAAALWADMSECAKLSAKVGVRVLYE